ncbi:3-hydroxyacyl-CoA dehydrogenase NAD-binding domain-containing protein [Euzebya tangerina]|uniref:3-hydroxyacyl-CoA dehydrogenase NAD-binding domain-containing protein n=1 Tax=Euzebya tangerina TaxID=591198 RepID=UPI000E3163A4|nr:3-hydroxyacyl-CoA dehydrogenase NAD-binding domain-containing protein [Euzebya tangerina]
MSDHTNVIEWDLADDGVLTLTFNDPNAGANTMNADFKASLSATIRRIGDELEDDNSAITGVILTSAKKTFFAGGNLNDLYRAGPDDAQSIYENSMEIKRDLRTLETFGIPVVAALNGTALGGGLEIALACHHRIAVAGSRAKFGQPEVKLGLLPGGGGIVRLTRMLGVVSAMMNVMGQGQDLSPEKALELGVISELVDSTEDLIPAARTFIKANPEVTQPWDVKGYKVPGGTPSNPKYAMMAPGIPSNLRKQLKGAPMPAPRAILAAAVESLQVPVDRAWEIEARYFADLATGQVQKNMTKAFFFDLQAINRGTARPDGYDRHTAKKVAVLGAGMMGAGIAYACARAGMQVVIKDVSLSNAERGKEYAEKKLAKRFERGKIDQAKMDDILGRITPTEDYDDLEGCDLIIEAVFESTALKHEVFGDAEPRLTDDALLCSNTSTIPITTLAEGVSRPEDFIGLHFFSPADVMPLVEIIKGEQTSDAAVAKAIDVVQQISKTPIVVNDSRGFFTSRVIGTFLMEALAMVAEGISPAKINRAGEMAGYPTGPLQLMDELNMKLSLKINNEAKEAQGDDYVAHPGIAVVETMVELDRPGRLEGAGFYTYDDDGKRQGLWDGLGETFPINPEADIPLEDIQERMLFAEAIETVKCFDEGVLETVPEANIGSIFGIGFPAWTGGVIQFIDGYAGMPPAKTASGVTGFVARAKELADAYGERFVPPASLQAKADSGEPLSPPPF